jgi:predicted amidophosphoribosyltransferase
MDSPACPHCGASVPLQGADDEWCEACGKQLPLAIVAAVHAAAKRLRKEQAAAAASQPPAPAANSAQKVKAKRLPGCAIILLAAAMALAPLASLALAPVVLWICSIS